VRRRTAPVFREICQRSQFPLRLELKTIHSPSGEYAGCRSVALPFVRKRGGVVPEALASRRFSRESSASKTSRPRPPTDRPAMPIVRGYDTRRVCLPLRRSHRNKRPTPLRSEVETASICV
jgi:hypothetical protein